MNFNPGGFVLPNSNNTFPGQQTYEGYPPQETNAYPPNGWEIPSMPTGYNPPQHPYATQHNVYPRPSVDVPPQQMPFLPQSSHPGHPYPSIPNVQYGAAAAAYQLGMAPFQQGGYPVNGPEISLPQPQVYPSQESGYPGKSMATTGCRVELSISCSNLKDEDVFSKSDPVCVLFEKRGGNYVEYGSTEMILNCLNPKWEKKFIMNYNSQCPQDLKFEIYDWDNNSKQLSRQDYLGKAEMSLGTILAAPGKQFTSSLKSGGGGKITILAEEINYHVRERIKLQLAAHKLDRMDFLGSSDPFYTLSKKMSNGQWSLIYTSEVVKNNCNPRWGVMDKSITEICNGEYQRELKIEIFDYDSHSQNDVIGEFVTNLRSLSNGVSSRSQYEVINRCKQRNKRNYKNSGTVSVLQFNSVPI